MIQASGLVKKFDDYAALDQLDFSIQDASVYGLVGTNGAGKSTLLRTISGIYRADTGMVSLDGVNVYEDVTIKSKIFLVADDLYFLPGATLTDMSKFYSGIYPSWSWEKFEKLSKAFPIHPKKKINTFSKGMKRQTAIILALSVQPDLLLLDEAFDGLDPVVRVAVRKLIADEVASRGMTVIISSHNLRELEDLCDHIAILHQGKLLLEKELDDLKLGFCKIQAAFKPAIDLAALSEITILHSESQGSVINMIVKGNRDEVVPYLETFKPLVLDCVPLTLEEVFIHEMEVVGYDYNNILF